MVEYFNSDLESTGMFAAMSESDDFEYAIETKYDWIGCYKRAGAKAMLVPPYELPIGLLLNSRLLQPSIAFGAYPLTLHDIPFTIEADSKSEARERLLTHLRTRPCRKVRPDLRSAVGWTEPLKRIAKHIVKIRPVSLDEYTNRVIPTTLKHSKESSDKIFASVVHEIDLVAMYYYLESKVGNIILGDVPVSVQILNHSTPDFA